MALLKVQEDVLNYLTCSLWKYQGEPKEWTDGRFDYKCVDELSPNYNQMKELFFRKEYDKMLAIENERINTSSRWHIAPNLHQTAKKYTTNLVTDTLNSHVSFSHKFEGTDYTHRNKTNTCWRAYTNTYLSVSNKGYTIFKSDYKRRPAYLSLKNWLHLFRALPYAYTNKTELSKADLVKSLMHSMIGREWIKDVPLDFNYPISNKDARKSRTLKEAAEAMTGYPVSNRLLSTVGLYTVNGLYVLVPYNQISKVSQFLYDNDRRRNKMTFNAIGACAQLISDGMTGNKDMGIISDYVGMSLKLRQKIDLNIGWTSLERRHRELSDAIALKGVKQVNTHPAYKNIFSLSDLNVQLIDSPQDLLYEGKRMSHCVASYANKINSGKCSIWHTEFNNEPYTIEVGRNGSLKALQIRGKYNRLPPKELHEKVKEGLGYYETMFEEEVRKIPKDDSGYNVPEFVDAGPLEFPF